MDIVYSSTSISEKAYAKVNLSLDVIGKRPDGYHDLRMVMQTVDLSDDLTFRKGKPEAYSDDLTFRKGAPEESSENRGAIAARTPDPRIFIRFEDDEDLGPVENNLIYKAAKLLYDTYVINASVEITLKKNIPVAAGMAGGSSDAAAALRGLNRLFDLKLSDEELCACGVKIGADVPYCIKGGTMLAEGIGEILSPLPSPPSCVLLIAKPSEGVSTGFVYSHLKLDDLSAHPDVDRMIKALETKDLSGMASAMGNILETVTVKELPVIADIKRIMKENGALNALMSGSGPTVFGLFEDTESAEKAKSALKGIPDLSDLCITAFH